MQKEKFPNVIFTYFHLYWLTSPYIVIASPQSHFYQWENISIFLANTYIVVCQTSSIRFVHWILSESSMEMRKRLIQVSLLK